MQGKRAFVNSQLESEILEQPHCITRILREGRASVDAAARAISRAKPAWALIAARGTSDNAARYAQYLLGAHNRLGVGLAVPSLFTLYASPPALAQSVVIGVSQSGQSPDIVAVIEEGQRQGAVTVAFTNDPESPLARASAHHVPLLAGAERAVAATKTYTAELMLLAMLSAALDGGNERWDELGSVPDFMARAIDLNRDVTAVAAAVADAPKFLVLGRGFNYATAFEIALKIKETSYVIAEPYSIADLLHGPVAMIDQGFPVILVAPSGRALGDVPELVKLLRARKARVVAISDRDDVIAGADVALRLPPGIPEWLSPIVAVVPGQLLALSFARARGLDPDAPRGLSKVTLTT
jgi:glucosamine--fructose-6-phosphate aminotransferase (isomerizing)